jgi:dephospho-CoA kinase
MRALRLGITGKIASGKSAFATILREQGIEVIDTDAVAKELMASDPTLRAEIITILGPDAYTDSALNKPFITSKIFSDAELRHKVEAVVHPAVMQECENRIATAADGSIVGVESALLVQTGYDELFDVLVMVWASDNAALAHARSGSHFTMDDFQRRLKEQDYSDEIKGFADFIIENDSTIEELNRRSNAVLGIIKVMALGDLPDVPLRAYEPEESE